MLLLLVFLCGCLTLGLLPGRFGPTKQAAVYALAAAATLLYLLVPQLI